MSATSSPIWPQPIEIIGLTGEFASGKTLYALSIDPARTRFYDTEKSAGSYVGLGFERIDVPAAMLAAKAAGYKSIDTFLWWLEDIRKIEPGKYSVIALDTVSEIESGLVDWVRKNPSHFGYTAAQFLKMEALLWGCVKEHWKMILSDIAARCQTFAFTSHLKSEWSQSGPTKKRIPKGKETLMELASLYLHLERRPDKDGRVPDVPSAVVLKSRLARTALVDGKVAIAPLLPPRLPAATPDAVRAYMNAPPDYAKLKPEELAPEAGLTDDERLQLRATTAAAERDVEQARLAREQTARNTAEARQRATEAKKAPPVETAPATAPTPSANGQAAGAPKQANGLPVERAARIELLRQYRDQLKILPDDWKNVILKKRGVTSANELDDAKLDELILKLKTKVTGDQVFAGAAVGANAPTATFPAGAPGTGGPTNPLPDGSAY